MAAAAAVGAWVLVGVCGCGCGLPTSRVRYTSIAPCLGAAPPFAARAAPLVYRYAMDSAREGRTGTRACEATDAASAVVLHCSASLRGASWFRAEPHPRLRR